MLAGPGEFATGLLQLPKEPGVLDGDDGLVREGLQQRNLLIGERLDLESVYVQNADRLAVPKEGNSHHRPITGASHGFAPVRVLCLYGGHEVGDVNRAAVQEGSPAYRAPRYRDAGLHVKGSEDATQLAFH